MPMMQTNRRRTAVVAGLGLAALALAPLTAGATVAPAPAPAEVAAPIGWEDCRGGFQCATVKVPLDHDDPAGDKISLALIRAKATDQGRRIGSLLINPGGPGGSGVDVVRGITPYLPAELPERFDIVGFDPRGIIRSTPLLCFDSLEEAFAAWAPFPFPDSAHQEKVWRRSDRTIAGACKERHPAILDHMSTADVARDMDLLRQALGDDKLNYLGYSYGSFLGQVYANLFPDKVRSVVIDGVLDPIAWSTGRGDTAQTRPFSYRLRSDVGARRTLGQFFQLCDQAGQACAFSGNSRQRYADLAADLRDQPVNVGAAKFTYAELIVNTLGAMYNPASWPDFAQFLADLEGGAPSDQLRRSLDAVGAYLAPERVTAAEYPNYVEGFPGVACSDSVNPDEYSAWADSAERAERLHGYFGPLWTWITSICQPWAKSAGKDRYLGPWRAETASPVLVVGNLYDPATPYHGAVTAADLLPNSRLLTYTGWGHTAFVSGNACVDDVVATYFVSLQIPNPGKICPPEGSPFGSGQTIDQARFDALMSEGLPMLPEAVRGRIVGQ